MSHTLNSPAPNLSPRSALRTGDRSKSYVLALLVVACQTLFYGLTLAGIYVVGPIAAKLVLSVLNGFAIGFMFIVAHDACHNTLSPSKRLNAIFGRVCLLPSLLPYTAWVYSHNGLHHGWTNLKGRDPVYAPLGVSEYRSLPVLRRLLERVERSIFGVGILYARTIWWRHEIFPTSAERRILCKRGPYFSDLGLVIGFLTLHLTLLFGVAVYHGPRLFTAFSTAVFWGLLLPFFVWTWLMGFLSYIQHTHPDIPWFDRQEEWSAAYRQLECTLYVRYSEPVDWILMRIMNHPAHHADPSIPLYRLKNCQRELLGLSRTYKWTARECMRVFRTCKLYDYERHQWLDFTGNPAPAISRACRANV